jgi:hypothetical protein
MTGSSTHQARSATRSVAPFAIRCWEPSFHSTSQAPWPPSKMVHIGRSGSGRIRWPASDSWRWPSSLTATALAHTLLLETVVLILAEHLESEPELREPVAALLQPIERQKEAVRATRRCRPPSDIDPGTGIEVHETVHTLQ